MYVNYKFTAEKYSKSRIGEKKRKRCGPAKGNSCHAQEEWRMKVKGQDIFNWVPAKDAP
jgi:hypothetical protein